MKLGQFVVAYIDGRECTLGNQLYQCWKSKPSTFIVDGQTYNKIVKHSTTVVAKAKKTRWYTFTDGSMFEVLEEEDWKPNQPIDSICWRSIKTWFEILNEEN